MAAGNSTFAIGGVSFSADSFVQAESFVLRTDICAKNPAHRKSSNRCGKRSGADFATSVRLKDDTTTRNRKIKNEINGNLENI